MAYPVSFRGLRSRVREAITPSPQSGFERVACGVPRQWLYLFDDGGIVFSETCNRFAGLDASGVAAYLALDCGADRADWCPSINKNHAEVAARSDLAAIEALTHGIFPEDESDYEHWPGPAPIHDNSTRELFARFNLHGIPVQVDFPPGTGGELCRDCFRGFEATDEPVRWVISASQKGNVWGICINGEEFFSPSEEHQLGLGMLHAARSLVYAEGRYDVAFHAGMVAGDDSGLMLCAPREAGKSTLAAYLVARGYDYVADEPTLLDLPSGTAMPLPLPISLKEGSWTELQEHWPQMASAPTHLRSDGTPIRLAHPANSSSRSRRVTHIVFPRYLPQAEQEWELLSPLQTLQSLHEGGMLLAKGFSRERFEMLLEWLARTPGYRMQYALLEEARGMLENSGGVFEISK